MTISVEGPAGVDDYSLTTVNVPRQILTQGAAATVMEFLKVYFFVGIADFTDLDSLNGMYISNSIIRGQDAAASLTTIVSDSLNPQVFAFALQERNLVTTGGASSILPLVIDLTDNNGNGVLVAGSQFFVTSFQLANTAQSRASVRILYRMVNIDIEEYVGIVAQQLG